MLFFLVLFWTFYLLDSHTEFCVYLYFKSIVHWYLAVAIVDDFICRLVHSQNQKKKFVAFSTISSSFFVVLWWQYSNMHFGLRFWFFKSIDYFIGSRHTLLQACCDNGSSFPFSAIFNRTILICTAHFCSIYFRCLCMRWIGIRAEQPMRIQPKITVFILYVSLVWKLKENIQLAQFSSAEL